jgi:hypothetical protein
MLSTQVKNIQAMQHTGALSPRERMVRRRDPDAAKSSPRPRGGGVPLGPRRPHHAQVSLLRHCDLVAMATSVET